MEMDMIKKGILFLLAVAFAMPLSAGATTMVLLTTEDMALKADDIVRAKVVSMVSKKSADGAKIYTYTTLKPLEWIKNGGEKPDKIVIRQLGGAVDGVTQKIPGDARFTPGEEALVFLRHKSVKKHDGFYFLLGMAQTKFKIVATPDNIKMLKRDMGNISFVAKPGAKPDASKTARSNVIKKPMILRDFIENIKNIIATDKQSEK